MSWEQKTLGELLEALIDHRGRTPKKLGTDFVANGVPVLSAQLVTNGFIDWSKTRFVDQQTFELWMPQKLKKSDVLLTSEAPLGRTAILNREQNVVLGQRLFALRGKKGVLDNRYLHYWLRSDKGQAVLTSHAQGTTVIGIRQSSLRSISVDLPSITTQKAIADVLGALDDKIAANQQVINAQDVLVQSLVRRENQAGVCIRLDDIAKSVSRGVAPKYTDDGSLVVNQRCIRNQAVDLTAARTLSNLPENKAKRLEPSDVLINSTGVGTLGRAARWIERIPDATADSHVSIVKFDERKVDPEFAGVVLTSMEKQIEDLAEGTTGQTELRRDLLSGLPLQLPRIKVQRQVGAQIRQFDASKRALEKKNQVLAATRDELLPLLMNGKITVAEAKEVAGDVGVVKQNQQEEGDSSV
ncbi:restriction endonuclease subunit S [Corynebacterium rouxii]|uniref:Restriction endonuclease subunit S n=1 Tax=Corynebacterium rouxii TaxID=2719119 RepID=A0ABU3PJ83_9CORY|nr:restriction endonuclease subunit S [Corynebacterium rouxii]MDT9407646.1 restriction endonuclease subunit S [Corynebacterium rouxii]MDT9409827.1 restriction endonuclease subunit S [Corynebacterium rouxii]